MIIMEPGKSTKKTICSLGICPYSFIYPPLGVCSSGICTYMVVCPYSHHLYCKTQRYYCWVKWKSCTSKFPRSLFPVTQTIILILWTQQYIRCSMVMYITYPRRVLRKNETTCQQRQKFLTVLGVSFCVTQNTFNWINIKKNIVAQLIKSYIQLLFPFF